MSQITKSSLMTNRPVAASQATTIEQSRAIAQVQGALVVAKQSPRDEIAARARVEAACQNQYLAEHAFFRFTRGGQQVSGPSVHLAREIARCWGNIDYGIAELARDDATGSSEMMAWAWDLETNARVVNTFISPHRRDTRQGAVDLTDMRDIYENNANAGARRLRECIFAVLPKSLVEEAKTLCLRTLEQGGGVPIEDRRKRLLEAFAEIGVTRRQIERKMGRAADRLTAHDIGMMQVLYRSIRQGETTVADEFPDDTAENVSAALRAEPPAEKPAEKPAGLTPEQKAALAQHAAQLENAFAQAATADAVAAIYERNKDAIAGFPAVLRDNCLRAYEAAKQRHDRNTGKPAARAQKKAGESPLFDDGQPEQRG